MNMILIIRRVAVAALLGWLVAGTAGVQSGFAASDYPNRLIKVVVPWPPGGIVDVAARLVADKMRGILGQAMIVENRAGAGGSIGAAAVAKSEPDGHTLVFTTSALVMNASLGRQMPFDVLRDFAPIGIVARAPLILVADPTLGIKSGADLVALAKAKPGQLTYASPGMGSPAHFATELFRQRGGIDVVHVPYKGGPEAMNDLIAGRTTFMFANPTIGLPQIQGGMVAALAITSEERSALLPNVPTMREAGFPDFKADQWLGFLAPRGIPNEAVEILAAAIRKALTSEDVKAAFARNGLDVAADMKPENYSALIKSDLQHWMEVAKSANIKAE